MAAPVLRGSGCEFSSGDGAAVEQDVSAGLQLVSMLSLGAESGGCCGLVCPRSWVPRASMPSGSFQ